MAKTSGDGEPKRVRAAAPPTSRCRTLIAAIAFTLIVWIGTPLGTYCLMWKTPRLFTSLTDNEKWLTAPSLAQVVFLLLTVPFLVFGFIHALRQFQESLARPSLSLQLHTLPEESGEKGDFFAVYVEIQVRNNGDAPARHYTIELDLDTKHKPELSLLMGSEDAWENQVDTTGKLIFRGNGEPAIWGEALPLCKLGLNVSRKEYPKEIDIPYSIRSPQGFKSDGRLRMDLMAAIRHA